MHDEESLDNIDLDSIDDIDIKHEDIEEKPKKKFNDYHREFKKASPELIKQKIEELIDDERSIVDFVYDKFIGFDFQYQVKTIFIVNELDQEMITKLVARLIKTNKTKLAKRETELLKLFSEKKMSK